jgi:TadE-like protein
MLTIKKIVTGRTSNLWQGKSRSQGMVEFAVALPILLMLLFAIIDFSLLFSAWLLIQNIARQAVRYAVTGQFDPANCPMGGCLTQADEDEARLLTIYDEALSYTSGLLVEGVAGFDPIAQDEIGYLKITVCTGAPYVTILPLMGSTQYGECNPTEHAGTPGNPVIVMVDFNHPYLTPFLNEIWPWVHLASYHSGIVEQFRVSRLVNVPPNLLFPTDTPLPPTSTFTPSNTPTVTDTPTSTPTLRPIYVEIIWPDVDGRQIVTLDETGFEAIAWDPEVGTNNGDGIDHLVFSFSGPGIIPGSDEYTFDYCAFNGDGPCDLMDPGVFNSLPNSNLFNTTNDYYMTVTAYAPDGRESTVVRRFKIMKPATATPTETFTLTPTETPTSTYTTTITRTPSLTRTPSRTPTWACSQFFFSTGWTQTTSSSRPRLNITLRNSSAHDTYIQSITFAWNYYDSVNPPQYVTQWAFDGVVISGADILSSPLSWTLPGLPGTSHALNHGESDQFSFYYGVIDPAWPGIAPTNTFGLSVTLGNGCVVTIAAGPGPTPTITRTATITYTPSDTFTITRTPTITNTPTITLTRTASRTSTSTSSRTSTYTRTNTVPTPTYTLTFTRTNTVPTPTFTHTFTRTNTVPTPTFTYTATVPTPTNTRTFTLTFTRTNTVPTPTSTGTGTETSTPTRTYTRTFTRTPTGATSTSTPSQTFTPSRTPTPSKTICTDC